MKSNIGGVDKFVRIVLGVVLISLVFWGPKTLWGLLGFIPLITGAIGFCPLYLPFRITTKK